MFIIIKDPISQTAYSMESVFDSNMTGFFYALMVHWAADLCSPSLWNNGSIGSVLVKAPQDPPPPPPIKF